MDHVYDLSALLRLCLRGMVGLLPLLLCLLSLLAGCATDLHGPKVDLGEIALPAPVPPAAVAPGPSVPLHVPARDMLRVWVVPLTEANGDTAPGHFRFLSLTPPAAELTEPPAPMPRVPAPGGRVQAAPKGSQVPAPGPGTGAPVIPPPPGLPLPSSLPPAPPVLTAPALTSPGAMGGVPPQQLMDSLFPRGR